MARRSLGTTRVPRELNLVEIDGKPGDLGSQEIGDV